MTREEAIKGLTSLVEVRRKYFDMQTMKDEIECLDIAIKALEHPEKNVVAVMPCGDAISKQAVKDMLMREWTRYIPMDLDVNLSFVLAKVDELPLVKPQYTEAEIQKMQELEQAEIQKAYELGKAEQPCGKDINVPATDAISRQAVDILIDELARAISDERCCMSRGRSTATIMQDILDLPYVTPQPRTVLYSGDGYADGCMVYDMAECPNCGYEYEDDDKDWGLPFCPNCGQALNWESEGEEE